MDVWLVAFENLREMFVGAAARLPNVVIALVVFFIFFFAADWAERLVRAAIRRAHLPIESGIILGRLAHWVIVLVGLLVALLIVFPTFTTGKMAELLGLSSIAIGFAFRDILQNFLAGVIILLSRPFRIGDEIVINEYEGRVEDITIRASLIRTYDGRQVVMPNATLLTESVVVNTAYDLRRSEYDVGIGYSDDIPEARRIMLAAMHEVSGVLDDPVPDVLVVDLAGSSVNLRARWWSDPQRADVLDVADQVLETIKTRLIENGIDLPFPTQQVLFHDQTEATDGDRRTQREGWPAAPQAEPPQQRRIADALREMAKREGNGDGEGKGG